MSSRNIRKLAQKLQETSLEHTQANDDVSEDEAFVPLYTNKLATNYKELEGMLSGSDGEADSNPESKKASSDEAQYNVAMKQEKKNKNNRKNRKRSKKTKTTIKESDNDDISKVVAEVNELLGEPKNQDSNEEQAEEKVECALLKIDYNHLNVRNEMKRLFGPDEDEARRQQRRPNLRLVRRQIVLNEDANKFTTKGLSMTLLEEKDGVKFFKFEHGPAYQKNMQIIIQHLEIYFSEAIRGRVFGLYPTETVEGLIENADLFFDVEENTSAINFLEEAINIMQSNFYPSFNYVDGKTRLEYRHVENRVFHITLLKYLHTLTNRACHRTALELAKLMLNLDPKDPLGVIFIMDTLALRAREHQWLVDIYEKLSVERDATRLFHLRYSYALAMYHLYLKNHDEDYLDKANTLIKYALLHYPNVSVMIMDLCKENYPVIQNHVMFTSLSNMTTSSDLNNLQYLYAKFIWPKWREGNIMKWLASNAMEIISQYDNDPAMQLEVKRDFKERALLFNTYPIEIKRHLSVISSMSNLLVEGAVPKVEETLSINPYPNQGSFVDVHDYFNHWCSRYTDEAILAALQRGILASFVASIVPSAPPSPGHDDDDV